LWNGRSASGVAAVAPNVGLYMTRRTPGTSGTFSFAVEKVQVQR
jgi:hypothetical protein